MLANKEAFKYVENSLKEQGVIERFEKECGPIRGRMMICVIEPPEELELQQTPDKKWIAFEGTFDFYNSSVGVALYTNPTEIASGIWITPQTDDAKKPSDEWVRFFIKTLIESINDDGTFGAPIYVFMSDTGDFKCIPTLSD